MRTITDHIVSGDAAPQLEIQAIDGLGRGGENHDYRISATYPKGSGRIPIQHHMDDAVIHIDGDGSTKLTLGRIRFQNGPIKEAGVNGLTHEALLAIVIDRLQAYQNGPFYCEENETALQGCVKALNALQRRTANRIARRVEGTYQQ